MKPEQKKKLLKAFIYGFGVSAAIIAVFFYSANAFGLHFVMGFPLLLIEAQATPTMTIIHISWLLPFLVGLLFAVMDSLSIL